MYTVVRSSVCGGCLGLVAGEGSAGVDVGMVQVQGFWVGFAVWVTCCIWIGVLVRLWKLEFGLGGMNSGS